MNDLQKRALEYIKNAGGKPLIKHFDEDHEPIGPALRAELVNFQLAVEKGGKIMAAPKKI